jgi:regulator of replication initiation timing
MQEQQQIKRIEEKVNNLLNTFSTIAQQHIALIDSNNKLLVENMRLMKENDELRRREK